MNRTLTLYVVKFRPSTWQPARQLSPMERYHGWVDVDHNGEQRVVWHKDGTSSPVVSNEGHELGSLRKLVASHVLTWHPQPGDQIDAMLHVSFCSGQAHCCPSPTSSRYGYFRVSLTTVLGRQVDLGEDGAEDAFGHDALVQTLEAALRGDFRDQLCGCEITVDDLVGEMPPDVVVGPLKDEEVPA